MNFFVQQEHARRQTRTLLILFALAVLAILLAVNGAMAVIWAFTRNSYATGLAAYPRGFFLTNTGVTLALIGVGCLIEWFNLRDGGDAVARMAGGRPVSPATTELRERRLLNVVEEMALASGVACPKVYLLDKEEGINAFAAGYRRDDAVVAITRGALTRLTRDELQGVIGHEFSHILNGDMRLNLRLIGLLAGIHMVSGFGRHLMDFGSHTWTSRERSDKGASGRSLLIGVGFALWVIGYIGVVFGRLIKSAISRQREFLADASAVQFTRNPDGLGGALRKIGGLSHTVQSGSRILHPNAEQLSHLFLGAPHARLAPGWFATHPPLEERLRRIYGRPVEMLDAPEQAPPAPPEAHLPDLEFESVQQDSVHWLAADGTAPLAGGLPDVLDQATRTVQGATALVFSLLLGEETTRTTQLTLLAREANEPAAMVPPLAQAIALLPQSARLPLLDRAMPALRQLSQTERSRLLQIAGMLIDADRTRTLAEFVLGVVLERRLSSIGGRAVRVRYDDIASLGEHGALLLSLVAQVAAAGAGTPNDAPRFFARADINGSTHGYLPLRDLNDTRIRRALDEAHALAPLAKPLLVKRLLEAAGPGVPMPAHTADLLRAICAALEAPVPEKVASTYTAYHWDSIPENAHARPVHALPA